MVVGQRCDMSAFSCIAGSLFVLSCKSSGKIVSIEDKSNGRCWCVYHCSQAG